MARLTVCASPSTGTRQRHLDYLPNRDSQRNCYWLGQGYALSGTQRHPLRTFQYDPAQEIKNLLTVIDLFEQSHGKPTRIILYGNSGGGFVGLGIAEIHPDRVDGVIAGCAHEQVPLMNMMFDGWFCACIGFLPPRSSDRKLHRSGSGYGSCDEMA